MYIREELISAVVDAINELVADRWELERQNPLGGDAAYYMLQGKREPSDFSYLKYTRGGSSDLMEVIDDAHNAGVSDVTIVKALALSSDIYVDGIHIPDNAVESWCIGEQEHQIEELAELDLSADEVAAIQRGIECYWDGKSDCVYDSHDYDVVWMTCDPEALKRAIQKLNRKAA